jgi:hypothetical protein
VVKTARARWSKRLARWPKRPARSNAGQSGRLGPKLLKTAGADNVRGVNEGPRPGQSASRTRVEGRPCTGQTVVKYYGSNVGRMQVTTRRGPVEGGPDVIDGG